jgi:hypothetical protein
MAELSPRHRELMRAMASELDSIDDPAERRRFAVGAIAAIVRLSLSGYGGSTVEAPGPCVGVSEPDDDAHLGGPSMSKLAARQMISPFVGTWTANAFLLAVVLLLVWRPGRPRAEGGAESLAIGS